MQSINFDTGIKEYAVNGDESRTIKINIADLNMLSRYQEASRKIEAAAKSAEGTDKPSPEQLSELDRTVREQLNYVFDSDVCAPAFGNTNCLSPVGGGKMLFQAFTEAFIPLLEKDIKSFAAAQKIKLEEKTDKYVKPVIGQSKPTLIGMNTQSPVDISSLTQEQKNAMLMELLK